MECKRTLYYEIKKYWHNNKVHEQNGDKDARFVIIRYITIIIAKVKNS